MDVLSDILKALRFRGTLYFSTEFHRPWGLRVPRHSNVARFHLVVRGSTWIRVDGTADPVHLESGDLILVPYGAEHVLADSQDTPCRTVDEVVRAAGFTGRGALVHGGEDRGAPTRLVCGHFEFDEAYGHPLLEQLPSSLVMRWDEEVRDTPLENAFRFISREVQDARPGHEAVIGRLSEVLFVQVIRSWADRAHVNEGVLAALADPRLGAALTAMHEEPEAAWTLERLGRRAAMSRTAFAERFREVMGDTPLQYLTMWRMQRARRMLATGVSMGEIARRSGYDSQASFARAFRKVTGATPAAWRRRSRAAE